MIGEMCSSCYGFENPDGKILVNRGLCLHCYAVESTGQCRSYPCLAHGNVKSFYDWVTDSVIEFDRTPGFHR